MIKCFLIIIPNREKELIKENQINQDGRFFLMFFPRKLWDLFKLNILYLLAGTPFFIVTMIVSGIILSPIINEIISSTIKFNFLGYDILLRAVFSFLFMVFIGLGPVTAGFAYVIREHASERPCMLK